MLLVWALNKSKKKQPEQSALYKQALFSFPSLFLFCYSRAVFTRVPFLDRKAKGVKELDRFCLRWKWCSIGVSGMSQNVPLSFVEGLRRQLLWVSWCRCRKGQPVSPCHTLGWVGPRQPGWRGPPQGFPKMKIIMGLVEFRTLLSLIG